VAASPQILDGRQPSFHLGLRANLTVGPHDEQRASAFSKVTVTD